MIGAIMDKDNRFLHEWEEAIKYLSKKNESIKEFDYFINIAKDYARMKELV